VAEEELQPWLRDLLEPADPLDQPGDEPLLPRAAEVELAPALRQPDRLAPDQELGGEDDDDDLEDVGDAARRQRQRRDAEQDDEEEGEALFLEEVDEAADRLVAVPARPVAELPADADGRRALNQPPRAKRSAIR
jgi:hypothetical protein